MTPHELTKKIKSFALNDAGFDLVGVSKADLPAIHSQAIKSWVAKGYAGSMEYMTRDNGQKRADVSQTLPDALSVISLAINYFHPEDEKPADRAVGKVARYAYGRDYHRVIEKKLKMLCRYIESIAGPTAKVKSYVDTGPILEKAFAKEASLGFFGKNTNLITKDYGSWVFLASLVTNLELVYDAPHTGSCGSCTLCVQACPTGALIGNYTMDARRCISYLTIESKEETPKELKKGMGEWIFGCDICQEVCPYNFRAKTTRHTDLYPNKIAGTWIDIEKVKNLKSDEEFVAMFQGSPLKRAKRLGLQRNAQVNSLNREQKSGRP